MRLAMFEWAAGLDVTQRSFKTGGVLIEMPVDMDVSKFPALEAGLVVPGVILSEECVIVAASPPDFSVGDSNLLFLGQRGR